MDYVLAKVKNQRANPILKLLSNKNLFATINVRVDTCIPYTPDHNLDEEAWFKIESFSEKKYCTPLLTTPFDSKEYDDLDRKLFPDIQFIFSFQNGDFYFQKVTPSLFLRRKMIVFGDVATIEAGDDRLVINDMPDAVYIKKSDALIFRNLATISSIFPGIDELYREATQGEVKEFLNNNFISLSNGFSASKVSKPNTKRIALAITTLNALPAKDRKGMLKYIDGYCGDKVKFDKASSTFDICDDDALKFLVYGIEQRFYTTQFGQERRLANSIVALK